MIDLVKLRKGSAERRSQLELFSVLGVLWGGKGIPRVDEEREEQGRCGRPDAQSGNLARRWQGDLELE